MQNSQHILVIRLSAMGDVAMTVPVLKTLLAQNSGLKITIVSKSFLKPLFNGIENLEFHAVDTKTKHRGFTGIYRLYLELKQLQFDGVADLHNVLRSKILRNYFRIAGLPVASIDKGRREKKALTALTNKIFKPLKSTHTRYADVFKDLNLNIDLNKPVLKEKETLSAQLKAIINYNEEEKLIGIAPFAAHEGKKYPLELMEQVIEELSKHNKILLFGGGTEEINLLENLTQKYKNTYSIAGKVKLEQELTIISNLAVMLSMDSGNGHFAAVFGIPTVTIWGATHPYAGFTPFLQDHLCITADRTQYPMLPTSVFGNKIIPGYEKVMHSISPKTIINKVLTILS